MNILRKKVENELKYLNEVNVSFEMLRKYGVEKLGPTISIEKRKELEELFGNDKAFKLENSLAYLIVKYRSDTI